MALGLALKRRRSRTDPGSGDRLLLSGSVLAVTAGVTHRRLLPFLLGVMATAALFGPAGVPADGGATPGAGFRMVMQGTGELGVAPVGEVFAVSDLQPGSARTARLAITNHAPESLRVRLRARAASHDLDDNVAVRVTARRAPLYSGNLGGLRRSTRAFALDAGETATLAVRIALQRDEGGHEGRAVDVTLEARS